MVALCWIANNRQWKQFVRRRVDQILESSSREDWYFCPGSLNPADLPSRGKFRDSLWLLDFPATPEAQATRKLMLLESGRCTMNVSRLRYLCIEIFKTINKLNPSFMQEIFKVKYSIYSLREINNLVHYRPNQITFGSNSLRSLGPQIWDGLPNDMKSAENLNILKDMLKKWEGPYCKCKLCKYVDSN